MRWRASATPVALPVERQSRSEVTGEPATNGVQKVSEPAAKDDPEEHRDSREGRRPEEGREGSRNSAGREGSKGDAEGRGGCRANAEGDRNRCQECAEEREPATEETQKSTEVAAKDAQETQKSTEIAAKDAQKNTETAAFPIEGYDEMNVGEVSERLDGLSVEELKRVRKYEKRNKDRGSLRKEMKQKIKTTS